MGIDNIKELALNYPSCIFCTTHMDDLTRDELEKINIKNIKILNDYNELLI